MFHPHGFTSNLCLPEVNRGKKNLGDPHVNKIEFWFRFWDLNFVFSCFYLCSLFVCFRQVENIFSGVFVWNIKKIILMTDTRRYNCIVDDFSLPSCMEFCFDSFNTSIWIKAKLSDVTVKALTVSKLSKPQSEPQCSMFIEYLSCCHFTFTEPASESIKMMERLPHVRDDYFIYFSISKFATNLIKNAVRVVRVFCRWKCDKHLWGNLFYLYIVSFPRWDQSLHPRTRCGTCSCLTFQWRGFSAEPPLSLARRSARKSRVFFPYTWAKMSANEMKFI